MVCNVSTLSQQFNVTEYVRKTWFVQEQQAVSYQSPSSLICVAATYDLRSDGAISVFNRARNVSDPSLSPTRETSVCAFMNDEKDPSKLTVASCNSVVRVLPFLSPSNYWVLDAGPTPNRYEWAIIMGGKPDVFTERGCTSSKGLWLFTRHPGGQGRSVSEMRAILQKRKILQDRLLRVSHDRCTYAGYYLK